MVKKRERATLKEIAEEAGVTITTVSCILNNKGGKYAEDTKERIFAIAKRLQYRPNALAVGVKTGVSNTAGVMIPNREYFYRQIINGVHDTLLREDTVMLLCWNDYYLKQEQDDEKERKIIHSLVDRLVDGIILRPTSEEFEHSYFEEIWEQGIPLVVVDRELSKFKTDFVGTDDVAGGRIVGEHLLELGHRNLAFVGAKNLGSSEGRFVGLNQALQSVPDASAIKLDVFEPEVYQRLVAMLQRPENAPTAVFAVNDYVADCVRSAAESAGLSIPNDFSLVGFGDQHLTPSLDAFLTTVDQHPHEQGVAAAKLYLERVRSKEGQPQNPRQERIRPSLILRESTAPMR